MKEKFRGYYKPTNEEFKTLWDNCIFIFDTNVLLNLYRYTTSTKNEFIQTMKSLSERIWIPYQVGFEFHKNRLEVVQKQLEIYNKVNNLFDGFIKSAEDLFNSNKKHPYMNYDNFLTKLKVLKNEVKDEVDKCQKSHPDLYSDDNIKNEITSLFNNKVGNPYNSERLTEIFNSGQSRYKNCVPPGYKDKDKSDEERYGDLVVWFQIIDYSKECNKPVIFITDDNKEDWWNTHCGRTIGPRPELVEEFYKDTNNFFYMYKPEMFIEQAQKYLKSSTNKLEEAISEIKEISEINKENYPCLNSVLPIKDLDYGSKELMENSDIDKLNDELNRLIKELNAVNDEYSILRKIDLKSTADIQRKNIIERINELSRDKRTIQLRIGKINQYKESLNFCPRCFSKGFWDGAFCAKCGYEEYD